MDSRLLSCRHLTSNTPFLDHPAGLNDGQAKMLRHLVHAYGTSPVQVLHMQIVPDVFLEVAERLRFRLSVASRGQYGKEFALLLFRYEAVIPQGHDYCLEADLTHRTQSPLETPGDTD